jgi:hypothetical protein
VSWRHRAAQKRLSGVRIRMRLALNEVAQQNAVLLNDAKTAKTPGI